jgi:hypothetical protein
MATLLGYSVLREIRRRGLERRRSDAAKLYGRWELMQCGLRNHCMKFGRILIDREKNLNMYFNV